MTIDERYYEVVKPGSFGARLMAHARDRIYADFVKICKPARRDSILDVGVSDVVNDVANVLERRYPFPECITACGLGPGREFQAAFPAVQYRRVTPGTRLPYGDGTFDIATSNAVLEHVGSAENQARFIADMVRVSKRVFVTVPHRFFPIEHHTAIPLAHWTDASWRLACAITGKRRWARTEELILMSARRLSTLVPPHTDYQVGYTGLRLGPFSSNLYLATF